VNVFFSAHGVPKSYVEEAGDPYKEEMEECVALIMNELQRRGRWVGGLGIGIVCQSCAPVILSIGHTACVLAITSPCMLSWWMSHDSHCYETCLTIMAAACLLFGCCRANEHTLAYQSRVGPVEWLQPYTDDSIRWGGVLHERRVKLGDPARMLNHDGTFLLKHNDGV
jgi:hypothetical protein